MKKNAVTKTTMTIANDGLNWFPAGSKEFELDGGGSGPAGVWLCAVDNDNERRKQRKKRSELSLPLPWLRLKSRRNKGL